MTIASVDPFTGRTLRTFDELDDAGVDAALARARETFLAHRATPLSTRATWLRRAAALLLDEKEQHARTMAREMGKVLAGGRAEIEKCAWVCRYYAEHAAAFLADEPLEGEGRLCFARCLPLGPVLAVMPWNFPFWQVFRFAAPALMAGNVGLLKHASNVPGCALAIESVFQRAGFPENVFRTLMIDSKATKAVIRNRHVRAVTLTGSTAAGQAVASAAGKALKKTVLELGGSDAYVILEDADVAAAAATCAASRLINSGQSCIAAKRFIVVEKVREEFERLFVERMAAARMGNPLDEQFTVGPLARRDLREQLHAQVTQSIEKGARCLLGGGIPSGPGSFYPPTVLTDVKKGMPAHDEELFGPVGAIIPVKNERAAIKAANDSVFGLGAAVFTGDTARGERIAAHELEAGCCFVNEFVKSDPRLPFGGIKQSGYGRELSHYGIKEFVNIKTVYVR